MTAERASSPETPARRAILERLRRSLADDSRFFEKGLDPSSDPGSYEVTHAHGDAHTLARRFGEKLEAVSGSYTIVENASDVATEALRMIRRWSGEAEPETSIEVLSWAPEALGIPGLVEALATKGISLLVPEDLHDATIRGRSARARVGITGIDVAFASTGSLLVLPGKGRSRAASLLPLCHLALVPLSKVQPTFEAWLHSARASGDLPSLLRDVGQASIITGPSKSADIELNLTLGVHGPRTLHALLYDDRVS